ncbi:DUF418 domain-containing protein [Pseudonocardia aurantiaca]|uniref:DUF418 domain-containing protein n=1 Tax=Pseudonocardia aurantiaca TaxID=75290 RepID=A0ABW4FQ14_9PSEU
MTSTRAFAAPISERVLAPDLARGVMLLLIALAHSRDLHGAGYALGAVVASTPLDTAVQAVLTLFVDSRARPMFALLFGYGLVQLARRRAENGVDWADTRRLLRRRAMWLVVFGLAHAVLLYAGDILAAYGFLALLFVGALRWSDRRLWVVAGLFAIAGALLFGWMQVQIGAAPVDELPADPLSGAAFRAAVLAILAPTGVVLTATPVLIGIWAARRRILEEPARHLPLLRCVAVGGVAVTVAGALPLTLQAVGVWTPGSPDAGLAVGFLHTLTGYAGGLGYAAIVALVVVRLRERRGPLVTALAACGQRSLTCYLAQSVVWFVTIEPYMLDLTGRLGVAAAAAIGIGTWVVTVVVADALGRAGRRGPAETLLRRLTYGPREALR